MVRKVFALYIILIIHSLAVNAQGTLDKKIFKEKFRDAEFFFLRGNFRESAFLYHELLNSDPTNANLKFLTGASYLSVDGMKQAAVPLLEEAVSSVSPGYREGNYKERNAPREAFFALGRAYHIENRFDEALEYYEKYKNVMPLHDAAEIDFVSAQIASVHLAKQMIRDTLSISLTDAGKEVNDAIQTFRAVLAERDSVLVYMSQKPFYSAIMMTTREKGTWTKPVNITSQVKADDDCRISDISPDGSELYIVKQGVVDNDLFVSYFKNGRWTEMEKINGLINSPYDESHACISADMKTLCFTSNRPGGYGAMDIYFSTRDSVGTWSEPVNAGKMINSLYSEATPFLSDDGSTLYFSSMGHATMGGYDIFYSKKLPDGTWSVPANIGFPLSTSDDDQFYFPLNRDTDALYCNNYAPSARGRVEWIHINPEKLDVNFTISGEIKTGDNRPIDETARVEVVRKSSGDTVAVLTPDPETGKYTAEIPSGDYKIEINAKEYKSEDLDLDLDNATGQRNIRVESNLKPESVASGEYLIVKNILFGFDEYQVNREGSVELEKLFQVMSKYPDIYVQVRGHTDSRGSSEYNLELSRKRARSVVDYLVSKGIARERFVSSGLGEEHNIAINTNPDGTDNPEGRRLNRQVEIKLINNHYNDVRLEEISVPERLRPAREKHYYVILEQSPAILNAFPPKVHGEKTRLFETDHGALYTTGPFNLRTDATEFLNTVIDGKFPEAYLMEEQDFRRLIRSAYFNPGEQKGPFTIQLLALKKEIDFSVFQHPEDIQLFEGKDGYHRYVTGIFESYDEAKMKANDYINKGYTDAFVMPLSGYTNTPGVSMDNRDPDYYFTVQITATKNKPDPDAYRELGEVRITLKEDGFYRVSQGIYLRRIEADKALETIRNEGYTDAFIRKISKNP